MSNRLQEIKNIVQQTPQDPFVHYALALEYKNLGMVEEAHQTFTILEKEHPHYVPSYLMHGNLLLERKQIEQAKHIFQMGITQAQNAKNLHALGELNQALDKCSHLLEDE